MRIACISDTHNRHKYIDLRYFEDVDTIIHAGDFTSNGNQAQTISFLNWFESLPIKHKIFVAGNHDFYCCSDTFEYLLKQYAPSCHYLYNSDITIDGIKIWGSPYSNTFGHWAFMKDDEELSLIWDTIPNDTNIVITHGPAYHIADRVLDVDDRNPHVGSMSLADKLYNLPYLQLHVAGHIHEAQGIYPVVGRYLAINASVCDLNYVPFNPPIVVNL